MKPHGEILRAQGELPIAYDIRAVPTSPPPPPPPPAGRVVKGGLIEDALMWITLAAVFVIAFGLPLTLLLRRLV